MKVYCVHEHNGNDTLLHAVDYVGAFTRGESLEVALAKMESEIRSYARWAGDSIPEHVTPVVKYEHVTSLDVCDADSDVIFEEEMLPMTPMEYERLEQLVMRSAEDLLAMYESIENKHSSSLEPKSTFLGPRPRTAYEMYEHTKSVNRYYFGEIGIEADNDGTIVDCRRRGFEMLRRREDHLSGRVFLGSYDERWSLRKVLRRFIWHDRIHGKAMYRMACRTFGEGAVFDSFKFNGI